LSETLNHVLNFKPLRHFGGSFDKYSPNKAQFQPKSVHLFEFIL